MSAHQDHQGGDCGFNCPVCEQQCDACGEWLGQCVCPTLPLDEEDDQ